MSKRSYHSVTVSVIVPAYNAGAFLREAIESALAQVGVNVELLVVDDGSTDDSLRIAKASAASDSRVRVLRHPEGVNLGVSHTRRRGLDHASGEYIAWLDADDVFLPGKLARQVAALEAHPDCVMCHGRVRLEVEGAGKTTVSAAFFNELADNDCVYDARDEEGFLRLNRRCMSTAIVHASALRGVDMAFPQLFQFEDAALWAMLASRGYFLFLAEVLTGYRVHARAATARQGYSDLKHIYASIEMLLMVLARSHDPLTRDRAEAELGRRLAEAHAIYGVGLHPAPVPETTGSFENSVELEHIRYLRERLNAILTSRTWRAASAVKRLMDMFRPSP